MKTIHHHLLWIAVACLGFGTACAPKRLAAIAQEGKEQTEGQIRAERLLKQGRSLLDAGKFDAAEEKLIAALESDSTTFEAHLQLGELYTAQGDSLSALAEYVAHTETAPKSRFYLDRMLVYVEAKFSRDPAVKREVGEKEQAKAMVFLSKALRAYRHKKYKEALELLSDVRAGLPRAGLVEYLQGHIYLAEDRKQEALDALGQSVAHNGYFARLMLENNLQKRLPGLYERLAVELKAGLSAHPADAESSLLLSIIHFRAGDYKGAIKVIRDALAWGKPRWDMLFVKAAGHDRLGQKLQRDQALSDLSVLNVDLSVAFSLYTPSLFHGLLAGKVQALAAGELAAQLGEPAGSYFRWRLLQEAGDAGAAAAWTDFDNRIRAAFPDETFTDPASAALPAQVPASMAEFMGAVRSQTMKAMPAFQSCDITRRSKRGRPSGRLNLRVEISADGRIGQAALLENTTNDELLAYCVIRKLIAIRFPKPLRKQEMFKMPIMFGPELDHLFKPDGAKAPAGGQADAVEH